MANDLKQIEAMGLYPGNPDQASDSGLVRPSHSSIPFKCHGKSISFGQRHSSSGELSKTIREKSVQISLIGREQGDAEVMNEVARMK